MSQQANLSGLPLFDDNGNPTLSEIGTFGVLTDNNRLMSDLYTYELLKPKDSSPGNNTGSDFSDILLNAETIFDITTGLSFATDKVASDTELIPEEQVPSNYKLDNIKLVSYNFSDLTATLGLAVYLSSATNSAVKRTISLEVGSDE